jgi:hypothetical protein
LYGFTGAFNSAFTILGLADIWAQLRKMWTRKQTDVTAGRPLAVSPSSSSYGCAHPPAGAADARVAKDQRKL